MRRFKSLFLKPGVSHKLFNELSKLIERFLNANSDCMIFGLADNLLFIFGIFWVFTTVVFVKNDVLLLVPTRTISKLGFPKCL